MHAGYSYSVFSEPIPPLYQHWNIHNITHFTSEIMLGFEYFSAGTREELVQRTHYRSNQHAFSCTEMDGVESLKSTFSCCCFSAFGNARWGVAALNLSVKTKPKMNNYGQISSDPKRVKNRIVIYSLLMPWRYHTDSMLWNYQKQKWIFSRGISNLRSFFKPLFVVQLGTSGFCGICLVLVGSIQGRFGPVLIWSTFSFPQVVMTYF